MARWLLLLASAISACAQAKPANTASKDGRSEVNNTASSVGAQCLLDAAEPREAKADAPRRVKVAHILVRHVELADAKGATRGREEACLRALAALSALKDGMAWEAAVKQYSDSQDSNLGFVTREDVLPQFADAAFELEAEQLSYVVETPRGYHVILRRE